MPSRSGAATDLLQTINQETPAQWQERFDSLIRHTEEDALDQFEMIELGAVCFALARVDELLLEDLL